MKPKSRLQAGCRLKRLFPLLLLLAEACSSPGKPSPPSEPQHPEPGPPPIDKATGDVLDEAEVQRRVKRMMEQDKAGAAREAQPAVCTDISQMPILAAAPPASEAEVTAWIQDLGATDGDTAKSADQKLRAQGMRIADKLREAADDGSPRGRKAAALLQVLEPGFEVAWSMEKTGAFAFSLDGQSILAWREFAEVGPSLLDGASGRTIWQGIGLDSDVWATGRPSWRRYSHLSLGTVSFDAGRGVFILGAEIYNWIAVTPEDASRKPAEWLSDDTHNLGTGDFGPVRVRYLSGHTVLQGPSLVAVQHPGKTKWSRLTIGSAAAEVYDLGATRGQLFAVAGKKLLCWDLKTWKLETEHSLPPEARWLVLAADTGRVVIGGKDWESFVVFDGCPISRAGRSAEPSGRMRAMAGDSGGHWIASADDKGILRIFAAATLEKVALIDSGAPVESLEFSPDGTMLVAGGAEVSPISHFRTLKAFRLQPLPSLK